ncbi:MAG: divergent polysaccharide deacetylase family protein [Proteobacteria bacterium]|nr:divergent polysaccharide deacetylase family protein [Pseudomonadota bacterium]
MTKGFLQRVLKELNRHRAKLAVLALFFGVALIFWLLHEQQEARKTSSALEAIISHLREMPSITPVPLVAVPTPPAPPRPRIAIVIDDVGLTSEGSQEAIALPAGVTLSFFPYAPHVQQQVDTAHAAGHEVFMHIPMEAMGSEDPGPGTLRVGMSEDELRAAIEKNLSAFTGYVGVNNHMGSRFTADEAGMRPLMEALKARELMFLDSRTTVSTKGEDLARELGVPVTRRHVFLDNEMDEESIANQFAALLKLADRQGMAVAIGHPHHVTLATLARLLPYLSPRYELVPVSALVK